MTSLVLLEVDVEWAREPRHLLPCRPFGARHLQQVEDVLVSFSNSIKYPFKSEFSQDATLSLFEFPVILTLNYFLALVSGKSE